MKRRRADDGGVPPEPVDPDESPPAAGGRPSFPSQEAVPATGRRGDDGGRGASHAGASPSPSPAAAAQVTDSAPFAPRVCRAAPPGKKRAEVVPCFGQLPPPRIRAPVPYFFGGRGGKRGSASSPGLIPFSSFSPSSSRPPATGRPVAATTRHPFVESRGLIRLLALPLAPFLRARPVASPAQ